MRKRQVSQRQVLKKPILNNLLEFDKLQSCGSLF